MRNNVALIVLTLLVSVFLSIHAHRAAADDAEGKTTARRASGPEASVALLLDPDRSRRVNAFCIDPSGFSAVFDDFGQDEPQHLSLLVKVDRQPLTLEAEVFARLP